MKNYYILIFLFIINFSFGQDIVPPSPEATSITQYETYPVDYSSGLVEIEIPIYTIISKKLNLPISIKYHGSGIKVNDISSVVGLGWTLNAGGVLTRTIKDQQDLSDKINDAYTITELYALPLQERLDYLKNENNFFDKESDYYTYSTPLMGGSFIPGEDTDTYIQIPKHDREIVHFQNNDFGGYRIYSEEGKIYEFETFESTNNMITGFYLSKLISNDHSDTIYFEYDIRTQVLDQYGYNSFLNVLSDIDDCTGMGRPNDGGMSYSFVQDSRNIPLLTQIKFSAGTVNFDYLDDRLDKREYKLNSVIVKDYDQNVITSISLHQSYFLSISNPTPDPDFKKNINYRLRLDSLSFMDTNNNSIKKYELNYFDEHSLPPYSKNYFQNYTYGLKFFGQDLWGFYNGVNTNKTLFPEMPVSVKFDPYRQYIADRSISLQYARTASLKEIIYPTGGKTIFTYGSNKDANGNDVGGLRIEELEMISNYGENVKRSFKYEDPHHAYFEYRIKEENNYNFQTAFACSIGTSIFENLSSSTNLPILISGNPVFYETVTEYIGDEQINSGKIIRKYRYHPDELFSGQNCMGTIGCGADRLKPKYNLLYTDLSWQRGQLIELKKFKRNESEYELVRKNENYYKVYEESEIITGLQSYNSTINPTFLAEYTYFVHNTRIKTGIIKLDSVVSKIYSNGQEYYQYAKYNYEAIARTDLSHQNVTSIKKSKSDGTSTNIEYVYSKDISESTNIIAALNENNLVSIPLETKYLTNEHKIYDAEKIEYSIDLRPIKKYKLFSKTPIDPLNLSYILIQHMGYNSEGRTNYIQKENDIPISFIWGYNNTYPIAKVENGVPSQIFYTSFENELSSNIYLNAAKTGEKSWSGDYTIPINKRPIQGNYTIEYWESLDYQNWNKKTLSISNTTPSVIYSTGIIDEVRIYPSGATMISITYKPLVGITTISDLNGSTTSYTYDDYNQLKSIKDNTGNTVNQFDYNFTNH